MTFRSRVRRPTTAPPRQSKSCNCIPHSHYWCGVVIITHNSASSASDGVILQHHSSVAPHSHYWCGVVIITHNSASSASDGVILQHHSSVASNYLH